MSKLYTAVELLLQGKKARKSFWEDNRYIYLEVETNDILYSVSPYKYQDGDLLKYVWEEYIEAPEFWEVEDEGWGWYIDSIGHVELANCWAGSCKFKAYQTKELAEARLEYELAEYTLRKASFEINGGDYRWEDGVEQSTPMLCGSNIGVDRFTHTKVNISWLYFPTLEKAQQLIDGYKKELKIYLEY